MRSRLFRTAAVLGAIFLFERAPALASLTTGALELAANFHTISVRAAFSSGDSATGNDALIEYRRVGEVDWREAPQAWIDVRANLAYADAPNWARNEARTKIFGVSPATDYEVRVTFSGTVTGPNPVSGAVTTRDTTPPAPAVRTVYVSPDGDDGEDGLSPATAKRTVAAAFAIASAGDRVWIAPGTYGHTTGATLAASGTPSNWIRVTRWPGMDGEVILEGSGTNANVLVIQGSYVRIDGLTIRRAIASCVRIEGGTTDHWLDGNRITDWNSDDTPTVQHEAGIAAFSNATRLVVMDNTLVRRAAVPGVQHGGGNGIWLRNRLSDGTGGGHHVIRGNTIVGGYDGIGSEAENDARGGYYVNTDVYENVVSDARDDCIQMEGANVNCAVFSNTVRRGLIGIAVAPNGVGPLFVMRNVHLGPTWSEIGSIYKTGDETDARTWIFHESGYNPDAGDSDAGDGIAQTNPGLSNFVTRNNAWHVDRYVIETTTPVPGGAVPSMDYDALFTTDASGRFVKWYGALRSSLAAFQASDGQEPNGIERDLAALDFVDADGETLRLRADSALIDAGLVLPGINSDLEAGEWNFVGDGPDIGALEADGADVLAPETSVAFPAAGATISGTIDVLADASDDGTIDRLELWIDGTLVGTDHTAPYSFPWSTTGSPDGLHVLETVAADTAGNVARSTAIEVGIDNGRGGVRNAYLRFKAKPASGSTPFTPRSVLVTDPFGPVQIAVLKPATADEAAAVQPGQIAAPDAHLTCYKIKRASGQPRFEPVALSFGSFLGTDRWLLSKDAELCAATSRSGDAPEQSQDDFRCYKAKRAPGEPKFVKQVVTIDGDHGVVAFQVTKPSAFCMAADAAGDGIADPAARLACYAAKPVEKWTAPSSLIDGIDTFGALDLIASKPTVLCLSASELP